MYDYAVPRRPEVALSVRLERIEHLAHDLARDLTRTSSRRTQAVHHAIADAIKTEIDSRHSRAEATEALTPPVFSVKCAPYPNAR